MLEVRKQKAFAGFTCVDIFLSRGLSVLTTRCTLTRRYKSPRKIPHASSYGLFDEQEEAVPTQDVPLSCDAVEGSFDLDVDFPSAGTSRSRALSL